MSTHCAIGTIAGNKFTGRYVHSDGYPTHSGRIFATVISRDSVDKALDTLTKQHTSWDLLIAELPELTDELRARLPELANSFDDPARYWTWLDTHGGHRALDGVAGYGLADRNEGDSWVKLTVDDENKAEWDVRWAYGVDREHNELVVLHCILAKRHIEVARLPLDALPLEREAWQPIEDKCEELCKDSS